MEPNNKYMTKSQRHKNISKQNQIQYRRSGNFKEKRNSKLNGTNHLPRKVSRKQTASLNELIQNAISINSLIMKFKVGYRSTQFPTRYSSRDYNPVCLTTEIRPLRKTASRRYKIFCTLKCWRQERQNVFFV